MLKAPGRNHTAGKDSAGPASRFSMTQMPCIPLAPASHEEMLACIFPRSIFHLGGIFAAAS